MIRHDSTVRELFQHIAEKFKWPHPAQDQSYRLFHVENHLTYDYSCIRTLESCDIQHTSTLLVMMRRSGRPIEDLYSKCKECLGRIQCRFYGLYYHWNVSELAKKQENAYLILCQRFKLPNDVVQAIETNESKDVRLGDALHHICHRNPNITREEVVKIISNGRLY